MTNAFIDCLRQWLPRKDHHAWVLGAVVATRGSVYRKTGALMLLSDAGDQLGLLSGGCLESDLLLQARKVGALGRPRRVVYDAEDPGSVAWSLGIGCGGAAEIALLPCNAQEHYLQLREVSALLERNRACHYSLALDTGEATLQAVDKELRRRVAGELTAPNSEPHLCTLINPPPHLLLWGGGADMQPVCALARQIGWRITLIDRARQHRQPMASEVEAVIDEHDLADDASILAHIDAAIVATHNLERDARALRWLRHTNAQYLGLLGPAHRKAEVLQRAGLTPSQLPAPLAGPMGLALGGDLPESIALSVLAQCHAVLYGSDARALDNLER